MDINDLRSAVTLLSMILFVGIASWAWRPRNRAGFEDAARLPFGDDNEQAERQS